MRDPAILALDLSLSSSGTAGRALTGAGEMEVITSTIHHPPLLAGLTGRELAYARCRRVARIRNQVMDLAELFDLVVLEGYSYGSKGNSIIQIAELGGAVRVALWEVGIPFVLIAPSELKRYATGKGNASKEAVLVEAVKRSLAFRNDEADARWLLEMALAHYGLPHVPMPKTSTAVLDKIDWPTLRVPEMTA